MDGGVAGFPTLFAVLSHRQHDINDVADINDMNDINDINTYIALN